MFNRNNYTFSSSSGIYSILLRASSFDPPKRKTSPAYESPELKQHALVFNFCTIDFSYAYDGITVYPKGFKQDSEHASVIQACSTFTFVDSEMLAGLADLRFDSFYAKMQSAMPYQRHVTFTDDDHDFYHADNIDIERDHYHIKFRSPITRDQFIRILNVLLTNNLISEKEKDDCLKKYNERYQAARDALKQLLSRTDVDLDTKAILNYIDKCNDNDILADLHEYLLSNTYDYFRNVATTSTAKPWQGLNRFNEVVLTNESWARIEKAFALRMAVNVCNNVHLSEESRTERAQQLSSAHGFFAIKRKRTATATNNNVYIALSAADNAKLDKSYRKHFGK